MESNIVSVRRRAMSREEYERRRESGEFETRNYEIDGVQYSKTYQVYPVSEFTGEDDVVVHATTRDKLRITKGY